MPNTLHSLQNRQTFVRILIFFFVTVIVWIGVTLFRSQQQTGISPELQKLAEPLNPNIDLTVVDRIQKKRAFSDAELQSFPIYKLFQTRQGDVIVTDKSQLPPDDSSTPAAPVLAPQASQSAQPSSPLGGLQGGGSGASSGTTSGPGIGPGIGAFPASASAQTGPH